MKDRLILIQEGKIMAITSTYFEFFLITIYMVITYHIIALKYKKSRFYSHFNDISKITIVGFHVFIVITNILLYLWLISKDFNPISIVLEVFGILMFAAGIFIIFWSMYSLRKEVFVPENKLIVKGPYLFVRHPMYLGGIIGAFGLALFAGSLIGLIYSSILALILSRIAEYEEEDLRARIGEEYEKYKKKVPKLYPLKI